MKRIKITIKLKIKMKVKTRNKKPLMTFLNLSPKYKIFLYFIIIYTIVINSILFEKDPNMRSNWHCKTVTNLIISFMITFIQYKSNMIAGRKIHFKL